MLAPTSACRITGALHSVFSFNVSSCKGRQTSDESFEMQQCGMTATATVTDNRESHGDLLPVDEPTLSTAPTRPTTPSRSSGVYSYTYDHMRDRFIAFLTIHLRHIQDLYARRNPGSRSSSVSPTEVPQPPGGTPPSSPLIPPWQPKEEDTGDTGSLQHSSSSEEGQTVSRASVLPAHAPPISHETPVGESACFYENMTDNEMIEYADVI